MGVGLAILSIALLSAVCNGVPGDEGEPEAVSRPAAVQSGPENVVTVKRDTIVVGPISGELRAEREATVRAELGGEMKIDVRPRVRRTFRSDCPES